MSINIETDDGVVEVYLSGEIDHHSAGELRERIDEAIGAVTPQRVILDFRGVTFMDSSGIGLVMGRYRLMQLAGGRLSVTGASERIQKIMRLAGLDRLHILEQAAADDGGQKEDSHEAHQ